MARISYKDAYATNILVIKDSAPLGCVTWIDTKTKQYKRNAYPMPSGVWNGEIEEGHFDRVVCCPEEHQSPDLQRSFCESAGVEILTKDEMDELRAKMGVNIGAAKESD